MKINKSVVKKVLDSFSEKQTDDVRFVKVVMSTEITNDGQIEFTLTSDKELFEPKTVKLRIGDTMEISGLYYKVSMEDLS